MTKAYTQYTQFIACARLLIVERSRAKQAKRKCDTRDLGKGRYSALRSLNINILELGVGYPIQ